MANTLLLKKTIRKLLKWQKSAFKMSTTVPKWFRSLMKQMQRRTISSMKNSSLLKQYMPIATINLLSVTVSGCAIPALWKQTV